MSGQLRYVERRVAGQRKTLEAAKTTAAKLVEAARLAQVAVHDANEQISVCEGKLREVEAEEQRLLRQRAAPTEVLPAAASDRPTAPQCVEALIGDFGDDPEAMQALQVIRTRIAAREQVIVDDFASAEVASFGPSAASSCPVENFFGHRDSARTTPYGG